MRLLTSLLTLAGMSAAMASPSLANSASSDMYVVMFRADWCAPCKIVEPRLQEAITSLGDQRIEYVNIDISNPSLSEISAHKAFDRDIVKQYNTWLGVTGFAAIIDADTKQTLGCVNMMYDAPTMAKHIGNLKTYALANQATFDITCPEANNPL